MDQDTVQALFSAFIVVATMLLVGFPVHEALHAWTAMKLGDNTARFMGRVTLDPRAHFDQMGGLILAATAVLNALNIFGLLFGYAKPTPVNPMNMRHGRQGHALVAFAGPASNLVIAIIVAIPMRLVWHSDMAYQIIVENPLGRLFFDVGGVGWMLLTLNVLLFIFNLIPVPPLDGWSVLKGIVPASFARQLEDLEIQYANVIPMLFFAVLIVIWVGGGGFLGTLIFDIVLFLLGLQR
jgi:Zn-dependent protease